MQGVQHTGLGIITEGLGSVQNEEQFKQLLLVLQTLRQGEVSPYNLELYEYYYETYPIVFPAATLGVKEIFNGTAQSDYDFITAFTVIRNNTTGDRYTLYLKDVVGTRVNFAPVQLFTTSENAPNPQRTTPVYMKAQRNTIQGKVEFAVPVVNAVNDLLVLLYIRNRQHSYKGA